MKKSIIFLLSICLSFTACNTVCKDEITKLYFVDNYRVHETGVEIWTVSEAGENIGKFIVHENIYSCEEDISRVVSLCCQHGQIIYDEYLYFSEEDFKEYIKERYEIN